MNKGKIKNFQDLKVWQDAHTVTLKIYKVTKEFPRDEQFGLISQMRRAASSVGANISEGFGRFHYKEKIKFYMQARASAAESQNHVLLASDLGYLPKEISVVTISDLDVIIMELNGLVASINRRISNPNY